MVVDILGAEALPGELLQEVILFVGGVIRSDDAELAAARVNLGELRRNRLECFGPGDRLKRFAGTQHGRLQAFRMLDEIESVAALDAQKLAVDAAGIAIVPAHDLVVAATESSAAAVAAMGADGPDVVH